MTNANATILLVDDDPAILLTLGDKLQFLGYTVSRLSRPGRRSATWVPCSRPGGGLVSATSPP